MLEQLNRINMLYDIYAPLLTARQQEVLQLYFSDNYSMGEIAEEYGITRQAVHDLIRRSLASIESFEAKLGLYVLFNHQQELLGEAEKLVRPESVKGPELKRLRDIIVDLRSNNEQ